MKKEELLKLLEEMFGPEAENALRTLGGENSTYNPMAVNQNRNGSTDVGLFQINSDTFADFMNRVPKLLKANGITSYDQMYNPYLNAKMARIIYNQQGWDAWYGSPREIRKGRPDEPLIGNVEKDISSLLTPVQAQPTVTPAMPTPTPSPAGNNFIFPQKYPEKFTTLVSPDPNVWTRTLTPSEQVKENFRQFFEDLYDKTVTKGFGEKNPADIYSGGINYGTDFATPKGTPVNLPKGNWQVVDAFSGATAEGPNNRQRGINKGYGNSVLVQNLDTGEKLRFSHLSKVNVQKGQKLMGGLIGNTGATGNVAGKTGQHLDLEYYDASGKKADVMKSGYFNPQKIAQAKASMPVPTPQRIMQSQMQPGKMAPQRTAQASVQTPQRSVAPQRQVVQMKPVSAGSTLVRSGDTLTALAKSFGTTMQNLLRLNPEIKNPNKIYVGQAIRTPSSQSKKVA